MDKQTLEQLEVELNEIIRIEQVMKYSVMTLDDVDSLKKLATSNIPRAEYLYGVYKLTIERNRVEAIKWLQRCQRHCNQELTKIINYFLQQKSSN